MNSDHTIVAAIMGFDDWARPWKFQEAVKSSLGREEQVRFDVIWEEAVDLKHWNSARLQEGAATAVAALARMFPQLERTAIEAVAKAAAYQWK